MSAGSRRPLTTDAVMALTARRAAGITGSVIDSSTSLLQRQTHDVVRFAMGSPAAEAIPARAFAESLAEVASPEGTDAFDYGPTEGEAVLREALLPFLDSAGMPVAPESLLITAGGMQGIDLTAKLFVDAGDLVVVESPTYTNGSAVISSYEGEILEAPCDAEGMIVEDLPRLVEQAGREPKLIYTIPTFQNPGGTTMSLERRRRLIELADEWGALILEDDPYGLLRFAGETLPGIRELSGNAPNVVGVYTFSKILAPGLRVGWVAADPAIVSRMIDAKQGLDTCTNVPMQRLVAAFINAGRMDSHLDAVRETCRRHKEAMAAALERELGGGRVRWTDPEGGFFMWVTFPENVDTEALSSVAIEEGVAFVPGPAFSVGGRFRNALRLSFATNSGERTAEGVRRLRAALERVYGDDWL